jgi:hypothetical protein
VTGIIFNQWTQSLVEMSKERELSIEEIRPAFFRVTERELPGKADSLRAIFEEGRDPCIFVRFETDPEGIEYILENFGGERVTSETINAGDRRLREDAGLGYFTKLSFWEHELGVSLFDANDIESCRVLEYRGYRGYKILIDDKKNTVYVYAYHR